MRNLFFFPALLLLVCLALVTSNRVRDFIADSQRYIVHSQDKTIDALLQGSETSLRLRGHTGADSQGNEIFFQLKGCDSKQFLDGRPYYAVPGQACIVTFASQLLCTFKLDLAIASPALETQTVDVSINDSNHTRFSFTTARDAGDPLGASAIHRFSTLLPAHRGKNSIVLILGTPAPTAGNTQGGQPVAAAIFGLRLQPHASPLDKAADSLGRRLGLSEKPESPFAPLQAF